MTTTAVPRRRSDNLAQRRFRTGGDHARADAPSRHRSQPAAATINDSLNQQAKPLPPVRPVISRLEGLCTARRFRQMEARQWRKLPAYDIIRGEPRVKGKHTSVQETVRAVAED
jgi:hypothetical protein